MPDLGKLLDLTLHPASPEFLGDVFPRWVACPPKGMGKALQECLGRARDALATGAAAAARLPVATTIGERGATPLELALGTALAHYDVYWLERSCGLRRLSRIEPSLAAFVRHPLELLVLGFPEAARLGMGEHAVWIPADGIHPLRQALRGCAGELRELLQAAGIVSYFAALVEATGYCLDRGCGLLELQGVADLGHLPNRPSCRAFFDRAAGPAGAVGEEALPAAPEPPEPVAVLLACVEDALEDGDLEKAARLLGELQQRNEDGVEYRLLRGWLLLCEGDGWSAAELLEGVAEHALGPSLAARSPALLGWALLARGSAREALPHLARAIGQLPCSFEDVERFALAAVQCGDLLEEALHAVRRGLAQLTPARFVAEPDFDWLLEAEEEERLAEPERFASLLALLGRIHAAQGFAEHAEHELEQALLLDADLPWAHRWLTELRRRQS